MRRKGISYDTGVFPAGRSSRPAFDPGQVRREIDVIARDLRCDAVRITGGDLDRLSIAARYAAAGARGHFARPITYAAAPWEDIDWEPFDIVSVDAYRDASNAAAYRDQIRNLTRHGKPAAVTEFGCCTYRGAADRGAAGWTIVLGTGPERRLDGRYSRDEEGQARYLRELLAIYEEEGIDAAFWFSFANYDKPRHAEPEHDLDLASFGVVAVLAADHGRPAQQWVKKQAFAALANYHHQPQARPDPAGGRAAMTPRC